MLALSPPLFSTIGWSLDQDSISHENHNYFYSKDITTTNDDQTADSFLHLLPSHHPKVDLDRSTPSITVTGDYSSVCPMAKKLNHNASERDRRKKINNLYASLRSLLPADQTVCTKMNSLNNFKYQFGNVTSLKRLNMLFICHTTNLEYVQIETNFYHIIVRIDILLSTFVTMCNCLDKQRESLTVLVKFNNRHKLWISHVLKVLKTSSDPLQKKLSIPNTISHALKYIPELQKQVEGLNRKREELLSRASKQEDAMHKEKKIKSTARSSQSAVSTYRLNDREVAIQISTFKTHNNLLFEILQYLEEEGLQLENASFFESYGGRVFYNLHLQVCFVLPRVYLLRFESNFYITIHTY